MSEPWGVSIIVVNYNYGPFLAAAIDSALGQSHRPCEVIVVDDCSTDSSQSVIGRYGGRIRPLLLSTNSGQIVAINSAWPLARNPIVIFLDADDLLLPHTAATVAGKWTTDTVKMQFPLVTIDAAGQRTGHIAPRYQRNLNTAIIRNQVLRTGGSPNSPGSGNAYSRSLLDWLLSDGAFELDNPREHHMDALLECNAPFYGEVITLYEPLACYRVHGRNLYAVNSVNDMHFKMLLRTFEVKLDYLARRCRNWSVPFNAVAVRARSPWAVECELVLIKLASAECTRQKLSLTNLASVIMSYLRGPMPLPQRIFRAAWFFCVFVSPRAIAKRLIAFRFVASQRPAWLQCVHNAVNITRRRSSPRP